jgi:hypothetical protein
LAAQKIGLTLSAVLLIGLVVFAGAFVAIRMSGIGGETVVIGGKETATDVVSTTGKCESDGENTVYALAQNFGNNSYDQKAMTLATVYDDKVVYNSATGTVATTTTWTALNAKCSPRKVTVVALSSGTAAGGVAQADIDPAATSTTVKVAVAGTANLTMTLYDNTLSNTSSPTDQTDGAITESSATAMAQGSSRNGFLDVAQGTSNAIFGGLSDVEWDGKKGGILWGIDTISSNVFKDKDISIKTSSAPSDFTLVEKVCSTDYARATSLNSLNRCYYSREIKDVDGTIRLAWDMRASEGNPGSSDDPVLYIYQITIGQDTDGTIIMDTHDDSFSVLGQEAQTVTWDNS